MIPKRLLPAIRLSAEHLVSRSFLGVLAANVAISTFAVWLALSRGRRPDLYFMEGRFTTWVSCLELLTVAALSFGIFLVRRRAGTPAAKLWLLMAGGTVFLAFDDAFEIHENFDFWIHRTFHLRETSLSDRIDDAVILAYALTSLVVLWIYRRELVPFRLLLAPMFVGFVFAFGSIFFDTIADRIDVLLFFLKNRDVAKVWQHWFGVGDDSCKLLAEGCFVAAFYGGWHLARNLPAVPVADQCGHARRLKASAPR